MTRSILSILYCFCTLAIAHAKEKLPNIVVFLLDDMGYGDLTITGASGFSTPHIDRLAREGMFFSNYYAPQPVCSASRAGLLTGCYPNRIGFHGALSSQSNFGIHPDEQTLAEVLKKKGYSCGMAGKWHLGHTKEFLPLQHGFDDFLGLPYSNDMWAVDYEGNRVTAASNLPQKLRHPALPLIDGNNKFREIWTLDDQAELTTLYTERALQFINANKDRPFLMYIAHSMPHVPLAVSAKFKGKSQHGLYGDVLMEIDWSVGQVLDLLEKLGLDENTLVIFTSDNGPWINFGNHAGSTAGLREAKGAAFEGGCRVPCIMRWKGTIQEGTVCNKLTCGLDILPTIAAITGAPLPEHKIDGVSLLPLLKGEAGANPRTYFAYYYQKNSLEALRNDRFKLVFPHKHRTYEGFEPGMNGFPGKVNEQKETGMMLFDLWRDPGERYDVQLTYPDVVKQLAAVAAEFREDLGDDLTGNPGRNRRSPLFTSQSPRTP